MTNFTSLVGMFFLRDNGDTYLTGEIIGQVSKHCYLLRPDNMNNLPAPPPHELMGLGDMARIGENGIPALSLFPDREAMTAWIDWIEKPSEPRVINLVKK